VALAGRPRRRWGVTRLGSCPPSATTRQAYRLAIISHRLQPSSSSVLARALTGASRGRATGQDGGVGHLVPVDPPWLGLVVMAGEALPMVTDLPPQLVAAGLLLTSPL